MKINGAGIVVQEFRVNGDVLHGDLRNYAGNIANSGKMENYFWRPSKMKSQRQCQMLLILKTVMKSKF